VVLATPSGFEPPISSVTGRHVRPLHHGAAAPTIYRMLGAPTPTLPARGREKSDDEALDSLRHAGLLDGGRDVASRRL
jgi:hypothetical protein